MDAEELIETQRLKCIELLNKNGPKAEYGPAEVLFLMRDASMQGFDLGSKTAFASIQARLTVGKAQSKT